MQHNTIKEVQHDLKMWGDFWLKKEIPQAWSSTSNVEAMRVVLETGGSCGGTSHLIANLSIAIHVPDHIQLIDDAIDRLDTNHKIALTAHYIKRKKASAHFLDRAEMKLISLLH